MMAGGDDPEGVASAPGQGWEPIWRRFGAEWEMQEPEPRVVELVERLRANGARRVHDLGCGLGRHTLLLAAEGFEVQGSDNSPTAVATCERRLREASLQGTVLRHEMDAVPRPQRPFDAVIAWNVIQHAATDKIQQTIDAVYDSLAEGGLFLVTFIGDEDGQHARSRELIVEGRAEELEPGTFVIPGDTVTDKALPHHYSSEQEIRERFLAAFELEWLHDERSEKSDFEGRRYPSVHWHALARK